MRLLPPPTSGTSALDWNQKHQRGFSLEQCTDRKPSPYSGCARIQEAIEKTKQTKSSGSSVDKLVLNPQDNEGLSFILRCSGGRRWSWAKSCYQPSEHPPASPGLCLTSRGKINTLPPSLSVCLTPPPPPPRSSPLRCCLFGGFDR